jgi:ankyrin repeat protein
VLITLALAAMEICFLASGETLTFLEDELQGQKARAVKKALAAKVGMSRFKQSFFVGDGSHQIQDDEVLDPAPLKIQLVVLEFWQPDDEKTQKMISASRENDIVALEQLLQHPLNPNIASNDGKTPLFHAAEQGHVRPMDLLLEAGAKADEPEFATGRTPLIVAALNGHLDNVRFLVEAGAAKDQAQHDGATPLWVSALKGHLDIVDQAPNHGATPLWVAALKGHLDIVRFLVEGGAAKDQAQNDGATPLLVAAGEGHLDIVRFLVAAGAAKDQARNDGATPFHHL